MHASMSKVLGIAAILALGGLLTGCGESVEGDFGDPSASESAANQPAAQPTSTQTTNSQSATRSASQPASSSAPADDPRIARGDDLFNNGFCKKCHGLGAVGGNNGPTLAGRRWVHSDGSLKGIAGVIKSGVPEDQITDSQYTRAMNPGRFTSDEYEALAAYLLSLQ